MTMCSLVCTFNWDEQTLQLETNVRVCQRSSIYECNIPAQQIAQNYLKYTTDSD